MNCEVPGELAHELALLRRLPEQAAGPAGAPQRGLPDLETATAQRSAPRWRFDLS